MQARLHAAVRLHQQGQHSDAKALYVAILDEEPNHFDALQLLGTLAAQRRDFAAAVDLLDRAIALKPDYAEAHNNRGNALKDLKRLDEALASYSRAIALKPDYAEAYSNRGNALKDLKRLDEALASYSRAIALKPDYTEAHYNRGIALKGLKHLDEALASYGRAIALKPDYAKAHWNTGLLHLLMGNFEIGWPMYEWRRKLDNDNARRLCSITQALWLGDADVRGQRILLHAEQGFGDALQFCRFVPQATALGAHTILQVPQSLIPVLRSLPGVSELIAQGGAPPAYDVQCPLGSLPLAFNASLETISGKPYLQPPADRVSNWESCLGTASHPRVGIVWQGSLSQTNDQRPVPLDLFATCLTDGIEIICLQKDIRPDDRQWLATHPEIRTFDQALNDFGDTAALISALDLVITIDTSVAHLAGALGKEVWILLPFAPDWRWLLDRSDSPWYDSAILFRQHRPGDWKSILKSVRENLLRRFGRLSSMDGTS